MAFQKNDENQEEMKNPSKFESLPSGCASYEDQLGQLQIQDLEQQRTSLANQPLRPSRTSQIKKEDEKSDDKGAFDTELCEVPEDDEDQDEGVWNKASIMEENEGTINRHGLTNTAHLKLRSLQSYTTPSKKLTFDFGGSSAFYNNETFMHGTMQETEFLDPNSNHSRPQQRKNFGMPNIQQNDPTGIHQSYHRLDYFLSYLSEKIKSNTLKISKTDDMASDEADKLS